MGAYTVLNTMCLKIIDVCIICNIEVMVTKGACIIKGIKGYCAAPCLLPKSWEKYPFKY